LETVEWQVPRATIVANVTGAVAAPSELARPEYWLSHLRQAGRFAESMQAMVEQGITHFVEVGPHPVLLGMGAECVSGEHQWLPSLRRDRPGWAGLPRGFQAPSLGG